MAAVLFETPFSFSENGKYFAYCGNDGKLKLWDAASGLLKQEYTKNLHLSSPCSCLIWLQTSKGKGGGRKRKLSGGLSDVQDVIAVGTTGGSLLLYSVESNSLLSEAKSLHTDRVNFLSAHSSNLFSCSDDRNIVQWDVTKHCIKSKWKSGRDRVKCIQALSCGEKLVTAGSSIKLWNIEKKEVIASYTGHASDVFAITELPDSQHFLTAARGDRTICTWSATVGGDASLPSGAVGSYLLQDSAASVHLPSCQPTDAAAPALLCAISESGVMHIFHQKATKGSKPTKPKMNVTVASDGEGVKSGSGSVPLPIHAAHFSVDSNSLLITYGNPIALQFETLVLSEHKDEHVVLVRSVKRRVLADDFNSRTRVPDTQGDVEYVTPATATTFRKHRDAPLEQRLENLALAPGDVSAGPHKKDNMAQLLVQGLQSRDRQLIQDVLFRGEESIINSTVSNIPIQALAPLLTQLTVLMQGKTFVNRKAVKWLSAVVRTHAAIILANPELQQLMIPLAAVIDAKMEGFSGLLRLHGRLSLVAQQMTSQVAEDELGEPLITYQERGESESDAEQSMSGSGSDSDDADADAWQDFSDMDQDPDLE